MPTKSLMKTGEMIPSAFEDFFKPWNEWFDNGGFWGRVMKMPAVNVTDNKENYIVSLAAPGLKKNDFKIDVNGNMLTISSEKEEDREEKESRYTRREYSYSSFSRSFTLPEEVNREKIDAVYEEGVLKLTLPKTEESKKAAAVKRIAVK
ncbi:MAG: heat-shock protein Hsp20 [Sphingobacteriales bacterium UTBCD1]|jgi:HSP20 family protein|nr:MAG: heat-shock protein Hsp20 [Sphingobacteriales bacterium UTBCD1]